MEALNEAYASYPDSQSLVLALAQASAGVNDWEAARTYCERTLELEPGSVLAREKLATALVRLGEADSAFAELRRLFGEGEAYARLGEELLAAERWGDAQNAIKKALHYAPKSRELALKLSVADSHLPFPTVVSLDPGDGIAIDVHSITVQPSHGVVELRGAQVLVATPEPEPMVEEDRVSGAVHRRVVVNLSSTDAAAELGPYSSRSPEKEYSRRFVSPSVIELGELPIESRDPVVSLAEFGLTSPVNLPVSEGLFPGLDEVSDMAASSGRGSAELAQLPLSRDPQVTQLVNGTIVASDENVLLEEATESKAAVPVPTTLDVPPAQLEPEMKAGNPLQPDLLCRLQDSTSASRAIPTVDSLMEEDFRLEGWALGRELDAGAGVQSYSGTIGEQPAVLWLPLTGLAALALLAFLRRRSEPTALVLEKDSGKH